MAFLMVCAARGSADIYMCHNVDGSVQSCENFTYAGSLVDALLPDAAFSEVMHYASQVQGVPSIAMSHMSCGNELAEWFEQISLYYSTNQYSGQDLLPMQNYIMLHPHEVIQNCPVAWLLTLLLKIESNVNRGRQGLPCARVHALGCIRDARGYWKMYMENKLQAAGANGGSSQFGSKEDQLLYSGEQRVAAVFEKFFKTKPS